MTLTGPLRCRWMLEMRISTALERCIYTDDLKTSTRTTGLRHCRFFVSGILDCDCGLTQVLAVKPLKRRGRVRHDKDHCSMCRWTWDKSQKVMNLFCTKLMTLRILFVNCDLFVWYFHNSTLFVSIGLLRLPLLFHYSFIIRHTRILDCVIQP